MVNYNLKSILLLLLKRWYIILLVVVVLSGISIPLAKSSYKRAVDNYGRLVKNEEDRKHNLYALYELCEESTCNMSIYMACLNDSVLMNEICRKYDKRLEWEELSEALTYSFDEDEQEFTININGLKEKEIDFLVNAVTKWLTDFFEEEEVGKIVFEEIETEKESIENIVSDLIMEPTGFNSNSRGIVTAGIMGGVLGSFIVLMMDYVSKSKKYENEKNRDN